MAMLAVLRRMEREDLTVHGFRVHFRDWASEATRHERAVVEKPPWRTRSNRRWRRHTGAATCWRSGGALMNDWAAFCGRVVRSGDTGSAVVAFAGARA